MKKIGTLVTVSLSFLGSFATSYADGAAETAPVCTYSSSEQDFADRLSDANKMVFCGMIASDRAACMNMVGSPDSQGNPMTPDQAVLKMVEAGSCSQ